jgi:hypothetical protein
MIQLTQTRSIVGAAWVLSIVGLGVGQALLQTTADAQRAASGYARGWLLNR